MIRISHEDINAIIMAFDKGGRILAIKEIKKRMPNINDDKSAHTVLNDLILGMIYEAKWMT